MKMLKIGKFRIFLLLMGHFPHSQKIQKSRNTYISLRNTYRTNLNLCELNSMCNTLKVEYKFDAWQIL